MGRIFLLSAGEAYGLTALYFEIRGANRFSYFFARGRKYLAVKYHEMIAEILRTRIIRYSNWKEDWGLMIKKIFFIH